MKGDRVECIINFLEANKFITNFSGRHKESSDL